MERVSFNVAKALKEAGYPQTKGLGFDSHGIGGKPVDKDGYSQPTYLEAWLWLWREKKICINCNYDRYNMLPMWWCTNEDGINYNTPNYNDPEEAITAAIEYLVDNNLIK